MPLVLAERLVAEGEDVFPESLKPSMKALVHMVEPDLRAIETNYLGPMLRLNPSDVEKYLDEHVESATRDFGLLMQKVMSTDALKETRELTVMMLPAFDSILDEKGSTYDKRTTLRFEEALSLEMENEHYFMTKLMEIMGSESSLQVLDAFSFDLGRMLGTSMRLYLCMLAFIDGIAVSERALKPVMDKLSALCLKYAEEKDAQLTTIDLVLDKEKHDSLEEAYAEYQKVARKSA